MNYKGLKYRTEWVEYPDIEALCKKIGAGHTSIKSDGVTPYYTLPVIYDPSTKAVIADSTDIADYLDKTYPDKPLYTSGTRALHAAFSSVFSDTCFVPLFQLVVLATCLNLNEPSYEYFRRTREASMGKLEDIVPEGEKGEKAWKEFEKGMEKVATWFKADGDKPFVGGDTLRYADIQIAAQLMWAKKVFGKDSKDWARIKDLDGGRWGRYLQQFDKYAADL